MDPIGGRYQIKSEIGRGGLGVVYRAYDSATGHPVAVKVLSAQADPAFSSLFLAKAAEFGRLKHPNIVNIFDFGEEQGAPYLVMEYLEGSDLQQILRQGAPLTMAEKIEVMSGVADGLRFAHEHGVIHGGIKPANIMRLPDGSAKLLDFGIAVVNRNAANVSGDYMSPEQLQGHPADELSDMWAFGLVLNEFMTGKKIVNEDPAPIQTLAPDCPPSIAAMGARLLKKNRDERYQNMADVALELEGAKREMAAISEGARLASDALDKDPPTKITLKEEIDLRTKEQATAQRVASGMEQARQLLAGSEFQGARLVLQELSQQLPADPGIAELLRHAETQMAAAKPEAPVNPVDEDVQFSVYRPSVVPPDVWKMLLVFAHRTTRSPNSNEPDPVQEVQRQAELILGEQIREYPKVSQDSAQAIPRQGVLTFLPEVEGITFQPSVQSVTWTGRVPPAIFLLSATSEYRGRTLRGQLCVFLGNIVIAQVPLAIRVEENTNLPETPYVSEQVRWYRRIFASYSHQDTAIVEEFENHAIAFGDDYLRDIKTLRAGSDWNENIRRMIREADVFQLFWSHNSMNSQYVHQEYNYALSLGREGFVRPVYWEVPMPESKESGLPPPALQAIHFYRIALATPKAMPATATAAFSRPAGAWYYADQGQTFGPLEDAAFENLVRQGVVKDDTFVWKEGMADWKAYSTVRPAPPAAATVVMPVPPPSLSFAEDRNPPSGSSMPIPAAVSRSIETRFCSQCGKLKPASQLSMVKDALTCPECAEDLVPAAVPGPPLQPAAPPTMSYAAPPAPMLPAMVPGRPAPAERPAPRKKTFGLVMGLCAAVLVVGVSVSLNMRTSTSSAPMTVQVAPPAVAVPDGQEVGRVAATAQLRAVAAALESYKLDTGTYPTTSQGLSALNTRPENTPGWSGPYLEQDSSLDPWGRPYLYKFPGEHGDKPDIISLGADGEPGGDGENADVVSWNIK